MIKVCITLSSRANYSSLKSIIASALRDPDIKLQIVAYGTSHIRKYGNVIKELEREGIVVDMCLSTHIDGNQTQNMSKSAGLGIIEFSSAFSVLKPDIVLVVGDRFEIISPVIAAAYQNIPIAHTMGGEITGTIDESIRHAVTKFSHLHFVATANAADVVARLGERKDTIFNVGCPRIDMVKKAIENIDVENLQNYLDNHGLNGKSLDVTKPFLILSLHPVTTELALLRQYTKNVIDAVLETGIPTIVLWPNADAGTDTISQYYRHLRERGGSERLSFYINFPTELYSQLLSMCACLIGNSSSGIREGAFIGTPVINIGSRQNTREHAQNVLNVDFELRQLTHAIQVQVEHGKFTSSKLYGDGAAGGKIIKAIKDNLPKSTQKTLAY